MWHAFRAHYRLLFVAALFVFLPVSLIDADALFTVMFAIGLGLLVVPGIVLLTWFSLAAPVIKIEGRSVIDSFRRGHQLVRGSFLRVAAVVLPLALPIDLPSEVVQRVDSTFLGSPFLADWLAATA